MKVRRSGGGERESSTVEFGAWCVWKDGYQLLCLSSGFSTVNGGAFALLVSKSRADKHLGFLAGNVGDGKRSGKSLKGAPRSPSNRV